MLKKPLTIAALFAITLSAPVAASDRDDILQALGDVYRSIDICDVSFTKQDVFAELDRFVIGDRAQFDKDVFVAYASTRSKTMDWSPKRVDEFCDFAAKVTKALEIS